MSYTHSQNMKEAKICRFGRRWACPHPPAPSPNSGRRGENLLKSLSQSRRLPFTHTSFRPPLTPPYQGGGLALSALGTMKSGISPFIRGYRVPTHHSDPL
jgi:hypothetical protein